MDSYKRAYAKVDLDAIKHNLTVTKKSLKNDIKLAAVVKADGYGHGSVPVSLYIEDIVDFFCVATLEEGINLRYHGITKPILILACIPRNSYKESIVFDIRESVFTLEQAEKINEEAKQMGKKAAIHIAIDTGMNRIGFKPTKKSADIIKEINDMENIEIEGVFTHFHSADESDLTSAKEQNLLFTNFLHTLHDMGIAPKIAHASNSAGILNRIGTEFDMVRCGITMYGIAPSGEVNLNGLDYRPALSIYSTVTYIKQINAGECVSYGATFVADKDMRVATISIGYADGYPRDLSNKGYVLIHGVRCNILGKICMDQTIVDVSAVDNAKIGDRVVILGESEGNKITVDELTGDSNTFSYEFICGINKRVPRLYYCKDKYIGKKDYIRDLYTVI